MDAKFFRTPDEWREWLQENHSQARELVVGFYKKSSGKPSITWPESVDAALCFGWIDGIRRSIDDVSYSIRFTPRKPGSYWSSVNIKRFAELTGAGLVHPLGAAAFEARRGERSGVYSYEQKGVKFDGAQQRHFRANEAAWNFFRAQPPWYQRTATWWVISAKRQGTRDKRLATLIADSEAGRTIAPLTRNVRGPTGP
jgi:uncharacterized protein YdeI (YjbR/CyaY-like superfamily)